MSNVNSIQEAMQNQTRRKNVVCSVYDNKAAEHGYVQVYRTVNEALRAFGAAAKEETHEFSKHASDYSLWTIGHFDPITGTIEKVDPHQIANATEFKSL